MDEIIIKVSFDREDGGYSFYVYDGHEAYIECEEAEGGFCDTTAQDALDMAVEEAKELLKEKR